MEDRVVVHEFLSSYLNWYFFQSCMLRAACMEASCMLCCAPCMEEYQESDF